MTPLAKDGDKWFINFAVIESELERAFAWQLKKTRLGLANAFAQVPIAGYRVDFLLKHAGQLIVVELDGRAFHNKERDRIRDERLIKHVDAIIRIPYSAMALNENATMIAISKWFDRFEIVPENTTVTYSEAIEEYKSACRRNDCESIDYSELDYLQVYTEHPNCVRVGSFKQISMNYDIVPVTLRTKQQPFTGA